MPKAPVLLGVQAHGLLRRVRAKALSTQKAEPHDNDGSELMSDCEKCGRKIGWIGGEAGAIYWCSRLGAVFQLPEAEQLTYCPFFYRDKRKLLDEPECKNPPGGKT